MHIRQRCVTRTRQPPSHQEPQQYTLLTSSHQTDTSSSPTHQQDHQNFTRDAVVT
ncbi:hypothetical protein K458DRAFT_192059 [Lentithecium fluviatile CBS 122367]|uniref:Uncharacterized protein n=1 Tax=Lentithecium fluviatile CBS 122367 TaxID=1168545 RepID=A0A6G1JBF8_9PLEO|nr:hypothetical protein K458DRAFT_192059 [Lentithecium fluviatile CBS 122367]